MRIIPFTEAVKNGNIKIRFYTGNTDKNLKSKVASNHMSTVDNLPFGKKQVIVMKDRIIKFGVAGLVRGKGIAAQIAALSNAVLGAVCDKDADRLAEVSRYLAEEKKISGFLCTESFDEMLASDIDAVFIATDANCHVSLVIKALRAGKHVMSEIPAVSTVEEAKQLKDAVEAHPQLKYSLAENCCYWAFVQGWKTMYDQGKFGDAVFAQGEYLHGKYHSGFDGDNANLGHWRLTTPAIEYITHTLGPLLYILNDRCVSVTCLEPVMTDITVKTGPSNGIALFRTQKGAAIKVLICFGAYVGFDHNFSLYGTKGMIETDNVKSFFDAHSFARFSDVPGSDGEKIDIPVTLEFPGSSKDGHGGADERMINDFVNCIIKDTKPPIDVDMALKMTLPGIYAHMSAQSGGVQMDIPDVREF